MNVLLVHGLGRTPMSMFGLAAALRSAGHRTGFFAYAPAFEGLPGIRRRLVQRLQRLARNATPVGLVGHSLGGLLLRMALAEAPGLAVQRLVMLATPNRPPRMAAYFWQWSPFRLLSRDCGRFLASPFAISALPVPTVPYTLIAGTAGPRHPRLPFSDEPNDGIVGVSEVPIVDTDAPILLPAWHSFIMDHAGVRNAVVAAMMTEKN